MEKIMFVCKNKDGDIIEKKEVGSCSYKDFLLSILDFQDDGDAFITKALEDEVIDRYEDMGFKVEVIKDN